MVKSEVVIYWSWGIEPFVLRRHLLEPSRRSPRAELVGTFFLCFAGIAAIVSDVGIVGVALAHGLALALAISAMGRFTGGHFNPAVTIAMLATGKMGWQKSLAYIAAQLLGGALAAFMVVFIFPTAAVTAASLGTPMVSSNIGAFQGVAMEAILTFFLVTCIFGTAVDSKGPNQLAGFGIGTVLIFDILAGGSMTGASMNPARTFGPALVGGYWDLHWVYWVGPVLGSVAAGLLYTRVIAVGQGGLDSQKGAA